MADLVYERLFYGLQGIARSEDRTNYRFQGRPVAFASMPSPDVFIWAGASKLLNMRCISFPMNWHMVEYDPLLPQPLIDEALTWSWRAS